MKYRVIGWTYYESFDVQSSNKQIGFAERNAIIDEIKKHKYLFSGWHHQESWENCVPILNDGKARLFSQRGWGGVMAEAYGHMNDMDYASYTFQQSISDSYLSFPEDEYNMTDFVPEYLENESFDVEVNDGLFEIASKKNPFYLDDLDSLRFIDENDTITLRCNGKELTFLVKDISRDKKELKFKKHELISTKYKVIVTHKPMYGKMLKRKPIYTLYDEACELFNDCCKDYDFNRLVELLNDYDLNSLTKESKSKKIINTLKQFAKEYSEYNFDEKIMTRLLRYVGDFELFEEIANKCTVYSPSLFISFINFSLKEGFNVDKYINKAIKLSKNSSEYILDILLRAIDLEPDNNIYRKKYYKTQSYFSNNIGFILMVGGGLISNLRKDDLKFVQLNDFTKVNSETIFEIAQMLSYPLDLSNDSRYQYRAPSYYKYENNCVQEAFGKYREYLNEQFGFENRYKELLTIGIDKRCKNMEQYLDGFGNVAAYIYALDALTCFEYDLRNYATEKYKNIYPKLIEELDYAYNKR